MNRNTEEHFVDFDGAVSEYSIFRWEKPTGEIQSIVLYPTKYKDELIEIEVHEVERFIDVLRRAAGLEESK